MRDELRRAMGGAGPIPVEQLRALQAEHLELSRKYIALMDEHLEMMRRGTTSLEAALGQRDQWKRYAEHLRGPLECDECAAERFRRECPEFFDLGGES